jgi:hypothetical protein
MLPERAASCGTVTKSEVSQPRGKGMPRISNARTIADMNAKKSFGKTRSGNFAGVQGLTALQ